MKYILDVSPRADKEVIDAVKYYNDAGAELARRFLSDVADVYNKITNNPQYYKYVNTRGRRLRCASLSKFPFQVIYYIKSTDIVVISVFNTKRKHRYK